MDLGGKHKACSSGLGLSSVVETCVTGFSTKTYIYIVSYMYSSVHFGIKGIPYLFTRNNRLFLQMQRCFALLSLEVALLKTGMVKTFPSASRRGRASWARFWHWIAATKNPACVSSSTFPALLCPIQVPRAVSYLCGPGNPAEPPTSPTWGRCVCLEWNLIWGLDWQDLGVPTLPLTGLVKFPKRS